MPAGTFRFAIDRLPITDDQVMSRVKAGSVDAFEVLHDRYCDRAYRVARSLCHDDGRAQEAVQEAFISIWRSRANYEDRGNVAAWVLCLVRHRAIDIARRNDPHATHRADEDRLQSVGADRVAEQATQQARREAVVGVLAALPEPQKEVIALAFYGELTHLEIAAHLDVPLGTVKGRMRLGMQRLRGDVERLAS